MAEDKQAEEFNRSLAEGAWLLRSNEPEAALEKLLPLYEQAPTNADVAINVGGAYVMLAKWNKAVRVLSKAAELHPENAMLWVNLAAAHLGRLELAGPQQQERATRAYERALAVNPAAPNVHYSLGLIYKERGELERAIEYFDQAQRVDPTDRDAQRWIARLTAILLAAQEAAAGGDSDGAEDGAAA
ncbi:MAG: tetratricopeptide repeat protein [Caldilinea sp.]|nr:tetratricopeptide repeat protein [Caldilinea sp.]MCB9121606.1 tetratricopeptide repeat protein [Caldilineaceae bacterium]MCB9123696.1 tetratricopeptide repeat protein [Caldilineaceae bacterium]MCO5213596.1 tetratricopeptide repeat protein [Caldilinea sp.]